MECFNNASDYVGLVSFVVACISELMGLTSQGPNGIIDTIRHAAYCSWTWIGSLRNRGPAGSPSARLEEVVQCSSAANGDE